MSYPSFESPVSVDRFVKVERSGKEVSLKYLLPDEQSTLPTDKKIIIVIGKHRYYNLLNVQLIAHSSDIRSTVKAPLQILNPIHYVWKNNHVQELKFYLSVIRFQTIYEKSWQDIESLRSLIDNPFRYEFFIHDHKISEKISPRSLSAVTISRTPVSVKVIVQQLETYYTAHCELLIGNTRYPIQHVTIQHDYFFVSGNQWYLCEDIHTLNVFNYFKACGDVLTLSYDVFDEFHHDVLSKMELHTFVEYTSFNQAVAVRDNDQHPQTTLEKIIYLSDLENFVTINPVIKYNQTEIPVLTKKQVYVYDTQGNRTLLSRNTLVEDEFIALLLKQHPEFEEQLTGPLQYFYVHKSLFLSEEWFLATFEDWHQQGIKVFGFNTLKDNKFTPYRAHISIVVSSGINWFNTAVNVTFGDQKVALKQIYKSVRARSKYVQLDDGTIGILPEEWVERFKNYFSVGDIAGKDTLRISKFHYSVIDSLYSTHEISEEVKTEIKHYHERLNNLTTIAAVKPSQHLQATLRPYQLQGLQWLNFLDDVNFGGCMADDMGLGKSIQVIAFILLLREKKKVGTHLLIVPTTLLYTWKAEFSKFAPTLNIYIHHGVGRSVGTASFIQHDVVITSYGTLISDASVLAGYHFHYIVLDESQNIKNPSSQRYKAVRLLQSENRIILSGTPLENNTFDLYAQFSFACPGLLGTQQHFKDAYAIPIDKFKNKRAATALQQKINPFILRRTKQQVADDLPEKTVIVLYCEMGNAQRAVYADEEKAFKDYIASRKEEDLTKHAMHILKGLTRLRQICNSPALVNDDNITEESSSKIEILMERLTSLCGHHKILVFSQFVSMLELIKKRLDLEQIPYVTLTGETTKRERVVDQFQHDEAIRVFLISLKAGGTGLNLTAADYVFIVDPWWNPAVENQAIDRAYRIGQDKKVIAVRLICKNTVEEKMMMLQQYKNALASDLITVDKNIFSTFSKKDFLSLTEG